MFFKSPFRLESDLAFVARVYDLATDTRLPFCWAIDWILKDPRSGIRRKMFDFVFWSFMDNG